MKFNLVMKKIVLLVLVSIFCTSVYSQKKKKVIPKKETSVVLAKADNLSAEIVKESFYLFINSGAKKDTLVLKTIDVNNVPTECKIMPFKAKAISLYLITWVEKATSKSDFKTEEVVNVYSEIFDVVTKTQVFANTQTTTNIIEKVFLDKLKNASEMQQKIRREGLEFKLNPDGTVTLKSKKKENKMTYHPIEKKFK